MRYRVTKSSKLNGFTRVTARRQGIGGYWEVGSTVVPAHAEGVPEGADCAIVL
jgi:hypothetical protein